MNDQNQQQIPSIQPEISILPGVGDLLKRTRQIYQARWKTILGLMIFSILIGVLLRLLAVISGATLIALLSQGFTILILIFYLAAIIGAIIWAWVLASLLYAIKEREAGIGIKESLRKGWHKILLLFWISILVNLIIQGGSLLFIIPGIIFAVWFSLAYYVLISEDLRGMNALFRSKQLVSGNWWNVFWRFLAMFLTIFIITLPVIGLSFVISWLNIPFVGGIINLVYSLFLTPFPFIFGFLIYEDLKRLKGEVSFEPPKRKTRIFFKLMALLPFLIIGISFIIILVSLSGARGTTRDTIREAHIRSLQMSLELYYEDYGEYPTKLEGLNAPMVDYPSARYISEVPKDPKMNLFYEYRILAGGKDYEICVDFEKKEDRCITAEMLEIKLPEEKAQITGYEIIPPSDKQILVYEERVGAVVYEKGTKAIVNGKNLSKVEFWFVPTGTGMPGNILLGNGKKSDSEKWEFTFTSDQLMVELYAITFDSNGKEVETITFPYFEYKKDETKNWNLYVDLVYGYKMKYPRDWEVKKISPESSPESVSKKVEPVNHIRFLSPENKPKYEADIYYSFGVTVRNNANNYSLEKWLAVARETSPVEADLGWKEEITVSEVSGLKGGFGCCQNYQRAVFLSKGDKIYKIVGGMLDWESKTYKDEATFNQMLSTFRFLE